MKRIFLILLCALSLTSCKEKEVIQDKYTYNFFGTFDTVVYTVMYAENDEKAKEYNTYIENRFNDLHKKFDKYNNYEDVNNCKTINDMAGKEAVKVSDELFDLIEKSIDYYNKYSDEADISLGALLNVWSDYRDLNQNLDPSEDIKNEDLLPKNEELEKANSFTGIDHIKIDPDNKTVYIDNEDTQIDLGAIAKGYAVELVAKEVKDLGCDSLLISAGGNVKSIGHPNDGIRARWGVGIQNPDILFAKEGESNILETIFVNGQSVVTSGDYQRYFTVDGKVYHHLIDKDTLYPGDYFRSVTVVTENSALADFLSTVVYLMPYEEGRVLVDSYKEVDALWIMKDGSIETTDGMKDIMLSEGATGAK